MKKLAVVLFLFPLSAFAATYYVTQSGAGSQNGTSPATAWSISAFNSSGTPGAGDMVSFSGTITSPVTPNSNGNSSSQLVLDFTSATVNSYLGLASRSYVTINGGTFGTSSGGGPDQGLVDFTGGQSQNITINGWTYTGPNNGIIDFVDLWHVGSCQNLTVSNNTVDNILHFVTTGSSGNNDNATILNNYARTSTNTIQQTDVIDISGNNNWVIQGNKLINRAPGNQSQPADNARHNDIIQTYNGGTGHVMRYNWIEQADSNGDGSNSWLMIESLSGDPAMQIYSNVFVGSGTAGNNGTAFDGNSGSFYCYNNTYIRLSTDAVNTVRFLAPGTLRFRNNVMQWAQNDGSISCNNTMTPATPFDYNFFQNTTAPMTEDQGSHGSLSANVQFTNFAGQDYSIRASSPLKNAGDSTIGSAYNQGIAPGATWPNPKLATRSAGAWDVGAFQSGGSSLPVTPQGLRVVPGR